MEEQVRQRSGRKSKAALIIPIKPNEARLARLIAAMQRFDRYIEGTGLSPSQAEYQAWAKLQGERGISASAQETNFGTWNKARAAASQKLGKHMKTVSPGQRWIDRRPGGDARPRTAASPATKAGASRLEDRFGTVPVAAQQSSRQDIKPVKEQEQPRTSEPRAKSKPFTMFR